MKDKFVDDSAVENLSMSLANALIVDDQIALFAAAKYDHLLPWNANNFQVFALWHAKYFKDEIRDVNWSINLEYLVLVAMQVDLVGILSVAELARTDLVNSCRAVFKAVVSAATT